MISLTDPLLLAGVLVVVGLFGTRYWQQRSLPAYYLIRVAVFGALTTLLLHGGVVPYRHREVGGNEAVQIYVAALEVAWWLGGASHLSARNRRYHR